MYMICRFLKLIPSLRNSPNLDIGKLG